MKRTNKRSTLAAVSRWAGPGLVAVGCLVLAASLGLASVSRESKPAQPETASDLSFIKKESLSRLKPEMAEVKRDPFRPVSSGTARVSVRRQLSGETEPRRVRPASILESLNLSCSGLVNSGNRRMALILVDGQAITLAEGEELIPGIKLTKISADEVIFQDDQGNSRKVRVKEK